jgi:glutathione S-transferase
MASLRLYRFKHSPYAWKVQALLELSRLPFEVVEVPFSDRTDLLRVSGGSMHVPVLVRDGVGISGSRDIAQALIAAEAGVAALVPAPWEGPIWAYADWVESELEDVLFRLGSPGARARLPTQNDRAFYTLIKDRKFGAGSVDAWAAGADALAAEGRELLEPTARTLAQQPFLFGAQPTLADCALHGQFAMLAYTAPDRLAPLGDSLAAWCSRMRARGVTSP